MKKTAGILFSLFVFIIFNSTICLGAGLNDLLTASFMPVGKCLYVYGGGWNSEDTAAGESAKTIGLSNQWLDFYNENTSAYDYKKTRYQIDDGLDCTGYIGWVMYQLFEDKYSNDGYVIKSNDMALKYSDIFGGTYTDKKLVKDFQCGDIMSCDGHAYIVVGTCEDGSVVLLHASPPNVSLCGTYTPNGSSNSQAIRLANEYMSKYFAECYGRYPRCQRNTSYLTNYNRMRWNENVISDTDGYRLMYADEILFDYFENIKVYINNSRVHFDSPVLVLNDKVYVPIRFLAEGLGADVIWNEEEKSVMVKFKDKVLNVVFSDDETKQNRAFIKNDRTYLPVRYVCEFLGCDVNWRSVNKSVYCVDLATK